MKEDKVVETIKNLLKIMEKQIEFNYQLAEKMQEINSKIEHIYDMVDNLDDSCLIGGKNEKR